MRGQGTRLACLFMVVLVAGCSSAETKGQSARRKAAATPVTLASNQVVIGERIEFAGTDGKPVVPLPGVYRVEAAGQDKLHAFFGKAQEPFVLEAKKRTLALKKEQQGRLKAPRAVLYRKGKSPARALLLFLPDGTVYESPGSLEGERARGVLLGDETLGSFSRRFYLVAEPRIMITAPAPNEVYWNRRAPLQVGYNSAGISGKVYTTLVHRVTNRSVAYVPGTNFTGLYHLDPGLYDVFVTDAITGVYDTVPIRVVGRVRSIAAGYAHSLALGPDLASGPYQDYLWAWGTNDNGQCAAPDPTSPLAPVLEEDGATGIRGAAVACGEFHSLMINRSGGVVAWGRNSHGQLGLGDTNERSHPVALPAPLDRGVVAIASAGYVSLALKANGSVWAWGWNQLGQCGQGPGKWKAQLPKCLSPVKVKQSNGQYLTNVVAIATSGGCALAVKAPVGSSTHATIWGWGTNQSHGLDPTVGPGGVPHAVPLMAAWTEEVKVRAIEATTYASLAVVEESDGSLQIYGWGRNKMVDPTLAPGQELAIWRAAGTTNEFSLLSRLGSEYVDSPVGLRGDMEVWVPSSMAISNYMVGTGGLHVLRMSEDGVWAWTRGAVAGLLPDPAAVSVSLPRHDEGLWSQPPYPSSPRFIAAVGGTLHSVALGWEPGGAILPRPVLFTWGKNNLDQLGLSDPYPHSHPNTLHFVRK